MPKFRSRPSHRREPKPTASWLVLGPSEARLVVHGQRTVHLTPVKPSHHRKRFHEGQRLQVKGFVGGPTEARVNVTSAERIQLRDVDYPLVRELGYVRLDQFQVTWVEEHDIVWSDRLQEAEPENVIERFNRKLDRFASHHAHRDVWVIRFDLDKLERPRLLAQGGRDGGSYRTLPDGRWQYVSGAEDREADRGYTSTASQAADDLDVLSDEDWKRHVHDNRDRTHEEWVALRRAASIKRLPKHLRRAA